MGPKFNSSVLIGDRRKRHRHRKEGSMKTEAEIGHGPKPQNAKEWCCYQKLEAASVGFSPTVSAGHVAL